MNAVSILSYTCVDLVVYPIVESPCLPFHLSYDSLDAQIVHLQCTNQVSYQAQAHHEACNTSVVITTLSTMSRQLYGLCLYTGSPSDSILSTPQLVRSSCGKKCSSMEYAV